MKKTNYWNFEHLKQILTLVRFFPLSFFVDLGHFENLGALTTTVKIKFCQKLKISQADNN